MNKKLQVRRGLHENIPILLEGEPGFSTDTKSLYIGTGEENVHIVNENDLDNKVHFLNEPAKQFNFVKNDNEGICKLEITKNDNITSYSFATTENHIEMSTGKTLHDEYMGLLKTMGREFESTNGSNIAVENGIEARVISGEICGRTIKNVLGNTFIVRDGVTKVDEEWYKCVNTDRHYVDVVCSDRISVSNNTKYTCYLEFKNTKITCDNNVNINIGYANNGGVYIEDVAPSDGSTSSQISDGIKKLTFTTSKESNDGFAIRLFRGATAATSENSCEFRLLGIIEGEETLNKVLPLGLSSTPAIITNNGQEHKFYASEEDKQSGNVILLLSQEDKLLLNSDGTAQWIKNFKYKEDNTGTEKLPSPIVTQIPKGLVASISTHIANEFSVGGAVSSSSYKLVVPTTDNNKKNFELSLVNGWTGSAKAFLTKDNKCRLMLELTAPEIFNALIINLPQELRPKIEKIVFGVKDITPVVIKIASDGTVKIPETVTGNIKIDATFELNV